MKILTNLQNSSNIFKNLQKSSKIFENIRKSSKIFGNLRKYSELSGRKSVEWNEETIRSFDLVLVSTAHDSVNYQELGQWAEVIVDTRNAMSEVNSATAKVYPA